MHNTAEPSDWDDTWVVPDEVRQYLFSIIAFLIVYFIGNFP